MCSTALDNYQRVQLLDHMLRVFSVLYKPAKLFQSGRSILHSHQQWIRVPVAPHSFQHLVSLVFWILAILIVV